MQHRGAGQTAAFYRDNRMYRMGPLGPHRAGLTWQGKKGRRKEDVACRKRERGHRVEHHPHATPLVVRSMYD